MSGYTPNRPPSRQARTWQRTVTSTLDDHGLYSESWTPWVPIDDDDVPSWVYRMDDLVRPVLWVVLTLALGYIIAVALASTWCHPT